MTRRNGLGGGRPRKAGQQHVKQKGMRHRDDEGHDHAAGKQVPPVEVAPVVELDEDAVEVGKTSQAQQVQCAVKMRNGGARWVEQHMELADHPDGTPAADLAHPVKRVSQEQPYPHGTFRSSSVH